jgi:serine/threonine protein kinase
MISIEQGQDYEDADEALLPFVHVQHLGHGHSGTVEEVRDRNTGEVYARKTIRITGTKQNRVERTRIFRNEVRIIRGLGGHCHIIAVHATYVTKRDFGILLSPVASDGDLELFLDNYNQNYGDSAETPSLTPQTQAMARVLERGFGCLAAGLAFIHMKRIRHKDIKPRNILVHKGMLVYTDFGYSFDSNGFSRSTTEGRPDFLTRRYSPPEAIQHEKRNSKSDIYSLGCVFLNIFSALTQAIAYDEDSIFSAIMGSIHEQLDSAVLPPRWAFISPIIKAMTMYERCDRPAAQLVATACVANEGFSCSHCHQLHSVSSDSQEDDDDPVADLRFAALMTSKWLSFGRVLFSPIHFQLKDHNDRVLVIDGLGKDWSYYCALTYPSATVYNVGPGASSKDGPAEPWSTLHNHRHICYESLDDPLPFPMHFFAAVVLRFLPALPSAVHRFVLSEAKRVLRPSGYLEFSVLDLDPVNMGNRARRAIRGLKMRLQVTDDSISLCNISDEIITSINRRGFIEGDRCMVGVPVASELSIPEDTKAPTLVTPEGPRPEISFADLLYTSETSESSNNGITGMVARVGRWWHSRCYESLVLPEANEPSSAANYGKTPESSIWKDKNLISECKMRGTSFRMLIGYAQKPESSVQCTVSTPSIAIVNNQASPSLRDRYLTP